MISRDIVLVGRKLQRLAPTLDSPVLHRISGLRLHVLRPVLLRDPKPRNLTQRVYYGVFDRICHWLQATGVDPMVVPGLADHPLGVPEGLTAQMRAMTSSMLRVPLR